MMLGAIVTVGILGLTASTMATIGNAVIARQFPWHKEGTGEADLPLDHFARLIRLRLMAKLFYLEALALWFSFAALLFLHFIVLA